MLPVAPKDRAATRQRVDPDECDAPIAEISAPPALSAAHAGTLAALTLPVMAVSTLGSIAPRPAHVGLNESGGPVASRGREAVARAGRSAWAAL